MGSLQKGKSSHLQKTWMSEQRVLRQPGTELEDWVESSSALAGGLLGPRHNGDHGTCPIQFNPHRILGAPVFLWCPSYRWGNGGQRIGSVNDTVAGREICTESLGSVWASPIKWGMKTKKQKHKTNLEHFLLIYWRHFRVWILPWVWPWPSVCKLMEERLCLPNPPHLLSDFFALWGSESTSDARA